MAHATDDRPASKVARLIDKYGLEGVGAELEARWTGDGYERVSLRDLADFFNKQVLERALLDAGTSTLEQEVKLTYRNLTDDDVSTGIRTDTRSQLERQGIDVDALKKDFITYQAMRSYLKEHRGAEYKQISDSEKIEKDLASIQRLLTRTRSVTEGRVEKLRETNRIDIDDFEILLDLNVLCQQCGSQYTIERLFEQRGCDCSQVE